MGGVTKENIPLGIWVIWDLMKKRRQDLFGPNYKDIISLDSGQEHGKERLEEFLWSCSFSVVFSFQGGKAVMEVGISPSAAHLDNEMKILQELGRRRGMIDNLAEPDELALPVLGDVMELSIVLGGVQTTSKGLVLMPGGKVIQSFRKEDLKDVDAVKLGPFLDRIIPTLVGD